MASPQDPTKQDQRTTRSTSKPRVSFGLDSLKIVALLLGALGLLVGIALYLIQGDLTIPVRVAVAAGIILIGAYVAIDPEDTLRHLTRRGALYGGNTLVLAIAGLGILGLLNVLAARPPFAQRLDLTANQQFTLSEQSTTLMQQLPAPVHATGYVLGQDSALRDNAESLLKQYDAASPGKLTFEFIDPDQRPAQAVQAGVRQSPTVIFQMGDQKQTVTSVSEQDFTTALLKLANPKVRKAYFTTGHGERDITTPDETGYSSLVDMLERENITVDSINLLSARTVPEDTSVLIIAAPTKAFTDEEKKAVQDYLDRGGGLMLLADQGTVPQVGDFVAPWNVQIKLSPVIDPASSIPQDPLSPLTDRYITHSITRTMQGLVTVYPSSVGLVFPTEQAEGVFTAPLAETSDRSWLETQLQQEIEARQVQFTPEQDIQGPITLVGLIEANAKNQPPADPNNPERPLTKTRVVVAGNSEWVSNQWIQRPTGNPDLFLNSINWLTQQEGEGSIRPKEQDRRQLTLSNTQQNTLFLSSVVFLPLLVLAAGVFVWWTRR
jgi:ABC-type uncharacterized transport system involved in gliding motility auxiliary subunit